MLKVWPELMRYNTYGVPIYGYFLKSEDNSIIGWCSNHKTWHITDSSNNY